MKITKVVIPVAGWGTRSLPASKNIPKEMLPIYNKPVVQYVVEEATQAGITDVVFITNRDKTVIEDHFDHNLQLEGILERAGKLDKLEQIKAVADMVNIVSIRQKEQLGLGHAVYCAKNAIGDEPFAVMVGDDLMFGEVSGIEQLIRVATEHDLPVVGVMEVPEENVHRYGIVDGVEIANDIYKVSRLVEKPKREEAPSRLAIVGRYVLTPEIFTALATQKPGHGGEIQLTDALQSLADGKGLLAVKMDGLRYDAGDWVEYLTANIYFALQEDSLRESLTAQLKGLLDK